MDGERRPWRADDVGPPQYPVVAAGILAGLLLLVLAHYSGAVRCLRPIPMPPALCQLWRELLAPQ